MSRERPILVLGSGGMLGRALVRLLESEGRPVVAPPRSELDLRETRAVAERLDRERPSAVINAAAFSDVTEAELPQRFEEVLRVNRDAPAAAAAECRARGVRFVFLSTDFVFDGESDRPYLEEDATRPLQVYGRSKLEGERAVLAADPRTLVIRTSTLFGPGPRTRPHYVDAILGQARLGATIAVVRTPIASPTYAPDLARLVVALVARGAGGVVHAVNEGGCSRLELARATIDLAFPNGGVTVVERAETPAGPRRPRQSILDISRLESLLDARPRSWREALAEYVTTRGPR